MKRQYTVRILAATILLTASIHGVAYADDVDPWMEMPRGQVADLLAKSAELDAVKVERDALKVIIAAQSAQIDAQAALIKTQDEMLARQERLTALADEESAVYKGRADRIAKDANKDKLWLRVQARAGMGATVGVAAAAIFPPAIIIGPVVGALGGLIEHWLID